MAFHSRRNAPVLPKPIPKFQFPRARQAMNAATMFTLLAIAALTTNACSSADASTTTPTTPTSISSDAPAMYSQFGNGVQISVEGATVVIRATGIPDHKSPYFATNDSRYQAYNGSNSAFAINPNRIVEQSLVFRIPVTPTRLSTPSPTPLGPIGVSVNGVPIFNQYAGPNQPLAGEINSFDQYAGHPAPGGQYHYHVEPVYLTRTSREALVGVLLDGYPVYGPIENGVLLTSANLDAAHGHSTATKEFPNGIYHYHTTGDAPYINGSGFAGSPGTVSR